MKIMKSQLSVLVRASALTACMFAVLPTAFAEPTADAPPVADNPPAEVNLQVVTNEELQTRLLNTLDNAQGVAAGIGMTAILKDQIEAARASVLAATPEELAAIPHSLYGSLKTLELGSGQMRLAYDPELRTKSSEKSTIQRVGPGMTIQSAGGSYDETALGDPGYPGQDWEFSFEGGELDGNADDVDGGADERHGSCHAPGSTYPARVAALNTAIVANAVNDIAGHFCDWVIVVVGGGNFSPLCVVTQVIASVATGIDENMSLCNEHMGAAEVSATWEGLKTVHSNVQHVHDDIAIVDGDLASHDADLKLQVTTHDTDIKSQVTTHDTDIKSQVTAHDTDIKSQVTTHDTDIKQQVADHDKEMKVLLAIHDTDIKARLGEIQGTVDENQRLLTITMARQLEIIRLLFTPSGKREINQDILSCTGPDCPDLSEILSCKNGLKWPCK
jgi:hypothetical protein